MLLIYETNQRYKTVGVNTNVGEFHRFLVTNSFYSISRYLTDADFDALQEEVAREDQRMNGYYVPEPVSRSDYTHRGGSKSGNTELRVAGVILNMIVSSFKRDALCKIKFTKKDIARQVRNEEGDQVSERTIQRVVQKVLGKMAAIYDLHYEIVNGRFGGFRVWTDALEELKKDDKDEFDETLIPKIKRKGERTKIIAWGAKLKRETKIASVLLAKATGNNKRENLPRTLAHLARKLTPKIPLSSFSRISEEIDDLHWMTWRLLARGYWQNDVVTIVTRALRETDMALADFKIHNPVGYLVQKISKISKIFRRPTPQEIYQECNRFWGVEKANYEQVVAECPELRESEAHTHTMRMFNKKLNKALAV